MIGRAVFWISFVYFLAPPLPGADTAMVQKSASARVTILTVLDQLDAQLQDSARQH